MLVERYETGRGYSGSSFNSYDAGRRSWHQTWVDSSGMVLQLDGGLSEGRMVLEGKTVSKDGAPVKHRITWTPNDDGSVRQLWESTSSSGEWTVTFDGHYVRRGAAPAGPRADARVVDDSLQQQVFAAERAFARSMADRNREAFASFVSTEAIFFSGKTILRGQDQVVSGWSQFFEGPAAPFSWEPDQVEVLDSGTLALSTGLVRDPEGEVVARFNSIWRLEAPGVWRVIYDKGSPPGPQDIQ